MALNRCCSKWRVTWQARVVVARISGMKRVLRLRDGDSERCSVIQEETRLDWEGHRNETGNRA